MTDPSPHKGLSSRAETPPGPARWKAAAINVFNPDKSWDKADMTPEAR